MAAHSSIVPGKSHGQRGLAGYSPQGRKESDTTEHLSTEHLEAQTKRSKARVQVPGEWSDHSRSTLHARSPKPGPGGKSQDLNHPATLWHAEPVIHLSPPSGK